MDGKGTAILTESCWLNGNRNLAWQKGQLEAELKTNLGLVRKIIWLPGIKNGHHGCPRRLLRPLRAPWRGGDQHGQRS